MNQQTLVAYQCYIIKRLKNKIYQNLLILKIMVNTKHQPIVQELLDMIAKNGWREKFQQAFISVH